MSLMRDNMKNFIPFGALLWILMLHFFVIQFAVMAVWPVPFDFSRNVISDLGATECGYFHFSNDAYACSPLHTAMNLSFIMTGGMLVIGAALVRSAFPKNVFTARAFFFIGLIGVCLAVNAFVHLNRYPIWHFINAGILFFFAALAMLFFEAGIRGTRWRFLRWYSFVAGIITAVFSLLFAARIYLGLGIGGMEQVLATIMLIWPVTIGSALFWRQNKKAA